MATVLLFGQVFPVEAGFTLEKPQSFSWEWQERNAKIDFVISIVRSKIDVKCDLPEFRQDDIVELHRRAFDLCRAIVGLNAFKMGIGLTVLIQHFVLPGGSMQTMLPNDDRLPPLCTAIHSAPDFERVFALVCVDASFVHLLSDLIAAITVPHVSVVNCARVVDGLKSLISAESKDHVAWKMMRDVLNVDERYLKLITDTSKNARHGKGERVEGAVTREITARAWNVMNRYLEFRKRGNAALPLAEFPILHG
jgi:hypothetical protein